jgi:hypothetical protein
MNDFTCEAIVNDFLLLKKAVSFMDDSFFDFIDEPEIKKRKILQEKKRLIQQLKIDTAFKLLTKLEANLKQDYNNAITQKKTDDLSKRYLLLCKRFRERIKDYDKPLKSICKRVALEDILDEVKLFFEESNQVFSRDCSALKAYFKFRHWYAHGRYFQHTPPIPDPEDIEILCYEFQTHVFGRRK